ncbi:hypothetical protein [Streptomyces rubellomurinus]|uniref:Uncharacterized protein n=1 Tax=Streptomyces rubellomurinus (strain ATCC 31215) TaxID=359131 RepID=A0A0F2TF72_STRR3|nr:hypothetical protein [Streptomyces rubellomurinus]KJS61858.1 hypothetical protein VM95_12805 [Streptomyces rubellomurinus]
MEIDRSAALVASGADRPVAELLALPRLTRALLATAVLFRPSQDVAELLAGLAGPASQPALAELRRLLAAVRPASELDTVLQILMNRGQAEDAEGIVDALLAFEPAARVGELLEASPWPYGPVFWPEAAGLIARATMGSGTTAVLIGNLLDAGHGRAAELLLDELATTEASASDAVRLLVRLAAERVGPEVRDRLTEGFCERRPSEDVAHFLHLLGRRTRQLGEDLARAVAVAAETRRADLDTIRSVLTAEGNEKVLRRIAVATGELPPDAPPTPRWFRPKR